MAATASGDGVDSGVGVGVAVGVGVGVGVGVAVGVAVAVGVGVGMVVAVGVGTVVGIGVLAGMAVGRGAGDGVSVGIAVAWGTGVNDAAGAEVEVGSGTVVGVGADVQPTAIRSSAIGNNPLESFAIRIQTSLNEVYSPSLAFASIGFLFGLPLGSGVPRPLLRRPRFGVNWRQPPAGSARGSLWLTCSRTSATRP